MIRRIAYFVVCMAVGGGFEKAAAEFSVQQHDDRVSIRIDGKLFTEYVTRCGPKPVLWPIIGPTGQPMTRAYPMKPAGPHEKPDHLHHRSFWFTHGDVNGIDFWTEHKSPKQGGVPVIRHREFVKIGTEQDQATIVTRNDWLAPSGERVLEDELALTFSADDDARWIDFAIVLKATDGDVTFGDTKEGTFGVRVAGTMKVESQLGGRVVNSRGKTDGEAWGQPAEWVDYSGPVGGEQLGIAIFSHPTNFRHPCRWHVRPYGLFTANPFGERHFPSGSDIRQGAVTIGKGESLALEYRVLLHRGDHRGGRVAARYEAFSKEGSGQ